MKIQPHYKEGGKIPQLKERAGVPYFVFPALEEIPWVAHGFSSRWGGVSCKDFSSMNFSVGRGDEPEAVLENFSRMAEALGVERDRMVVSWQTHTDRVRLATEEDEGKGVVRPRDYRDVDGLITNVPGITLVTLYADCVPVYLVDPVKRAIGLCHSGWRGTVQGIGEKTVRKMAEAFGSEPEDLIGCIGPSICADCFEVGPEVAEEFKMAFPAEYHERLCPFYGASGKYHVDLWLANRLVLRRAGLLESKIHATNLCTKCNPQVFFSHRAMGGRRGNMGAFLCMKE
ncbi:MAG: peptidoglycan editing factor PgeF [Lachnospiraceae bacterium]|nr:peptidoglycan editing factor PgeF [Lachnospiraceae bacterium]